jgi:hypothetical protein
MTIELTNEQFQTLAGVVDVAIKALGIRAMEDDVIALMAAIKAAGATATDESPSE